MLDQKLRVAGIPITLCRTFESVCVCVCMCVYLCACVYCTVALRMHCGNDRQR